MPTRRCTPHTMAVAPLVSVTPHTPAKATATATHDARYSTTACRVTHQHTLDTASGEGSDVGVTEGLLDGVRCCGLAPLLFQLHISPLFGFFLQFQAVAHSVNNGCSTNNQQRLLCTRTFEYTLHPLPAAVFPLRAARSHLLRTFGIASPRTTAGGHELRTCHMHTYNHTHTKAYLSAGVASCHCLDANGAVLSKHLRWRGCGTSSGSSTCVGV